MYADLFISYHLAYIHDNLATTQKSKRTKLVGFPLSDPIFERLAHPHSTNIHQHTP